MPQTIIGDKEKAVRLYKNPNLTIAEISNLTNISTDALAKIYRKEFANGTLTPRHEHSALKPRTPNGQGKSGYVPTGKKRGNPSFGSNKKFTHEQEVEIAKDYYENDLSMSQIKVKWGIHPMQMQRIRNEFRGKYGIKENANNFCKNKYKRVSDDRP